MYNRLGFRVLRLSLPMLTNATASLIAAARAPATTAPELKAAAQSFFNAVGRASVADANQAIRTLSEHLNLADASRAGFLALVCGALIERGCDPAVFGASLTQRLKPLLSAA